MMPLGSLMARAGETVLRARIETVHTAVKVVLDGNGAGIVAIARNGKIMAEISIPEESTSTDGFALTVAHQVFVHQRPEGAAQ